jgi:hypothetical protein
MEKNILVSVHDEASARYCCKKGRREMKNTHVADVCGFVVGDGYVVESGVGRSGKKHKKKLWARGSKDRSAQKTSKLNDVIGE